MASTDEGDAAPVSRRAATDADGPRTNPDNWQDARRGVSARTPAKQKPAEAGQDDGGEEADQGRGDKKPKDKSGGENEDRGGEARPPWYKRPLFIAILIAVVLAVGVGVLLWWLHVRKFEKTDDAFIDARPVTVAPQVAGRVLRVLVTDNQDVAAGQPLVEIDPADYEAKVALARAQVTVAEAGAAQAEAQVGVADANATNAAQDLRRVESVSNTGAVPQQQLDAARAAARSTAAQLVAARKAAAAANSQVAAARAELSAAQLNLSYANVPAPQAGQVTHLTVAAGNYVQPGQELMAIVPRDVWVTANFKETQLAHMKVGQPVTIEVDAYPDLELRGHVDSVQAGSGAAFSLLPPENATGNYVKVVQRVPVKIVLDDRPDADHRLAPGMSVVPKVRVRD